MTETETPRPTVLERAVILVASSMTVMAGAILAPSLPKLADAFSTTAGVDLLSKLVLTLPALAITLAASGAGVLVDRFGRRPVLLASLVLYAVAGTSGLYLQDLHALLVGRFFLGVAVAGCMTAATTLIGDLFLGEERARFMGTQAAFMALGGVVYVIGGGFLADLHWRGPFAVYAASLLVAALALGLREPPASIRGQVASDDATIPWPLIATLGAYALCGMILMYLVPTQLPFHLRASLGSSSVEVGIAISAMTAAGAVGSLVYPYIVQRVGPQLTLALTFAFPTVGFWSLSQASTFAMVVVSTLTTGFGMGILLPAIGTWVTRVAPASHRGRLIGIATMCFFLGQFLSPIAAAPFAADGVPRVFGVASVFAAALSGVSLAWATVIAWSPKRATA